MEIFFQHWPSSKKKHAQGMQRQTKLKKFDIKLAISVKLQYLITTANAPA
jgi:hypothetical protein